MKIKIIAIGKLDFQIEKIFLEYKKRLSKFCKIETEFLKEIKINRQLKKKF